MPNPLRIGISSSGANSASFYQPELFEQYTYVKATVQGGLFDCYTAWPSGGTLTRHILTVNTQYLISDFLTSDIKRINLSGSGGTIFELSHDE